MKKIINLSILLAVILTLSSCNAFKGWFGKSGPDILITAGTSYASSCTVSDDYVIFRDLTMTTKGKDGYITGYTIGVQLSTDASFPKGSTIEAETTDIAYPENFISSSGTYRGSVKVEGLTKCTKYSYRTYAQYKGKTVYGSTQALTTYTNLATSVSVDRDRLALRVRQGEYVSVSVFPEDAQDRNDLVWESSDESVAVVRFGSINAVGVGSCTVTVSTTKGHTASLRVDVRKVDVTGIDFPNGAVHLGVGTLGQTSELGSADLSGAARILPDSASFLGVKYSVVDEGIARIGSDGKLVGVKEGHTYIEFMSEDNPSVVGRCDVCVNDLREDEGQHVVDMGLSVDWGSEYLTYDHPVYGLTKYFGWGSI